MEEPAGKSAMHHKLDQAMWLLDPPPPVHLESTQVAKAHDILLDLVAEWSTISLHPRASSAITCFNGKEQQQYNSSWIGARADLFRALLVSSYLLLEICPRGGEEEDQSFFTATVPTLTQESVKVLQRTIERCTLLLQALMSNSSLCRHSYNKDWQASLPPSRYPLLQAVLQDEQLIPCTIGEQGKWFEECETAKKRGTQSQDYLYIDNDEDMANMDPIQIVEEEQVLIGIASTPVPLASNNAHYHFARQGQLLLIHENRNDLAKLPLRVMVKLLRCGLLWLQESQDDDNKQEEHELWCLSSQSTCRVTIRDNEFCFAIENARLISLQSHNKFSTSNNVLLLQVPSGLAEGSAWVKAVEHMISKITQHEQLQYYLQQVWGRNEYNESIKNSQRLFWQAMGNRVHDSQE